MSFQIRPATRADEPEIQAVIRAVYDEYGFTWDASDYHADLYDLGSFYFNDGHRFWVAEVQGKVCGTAALMRHELIEGPAGSLVQVDDQFRIAGTDCSLERLYVHPNARRLGLGTALTQGVIDHAYAARHRAMEIWSDKRFGDAHRLYGRFGAEVVGDRICDDPDESPEWGLWLPLLK